jgi:type I restriction enzyme M protein
MNQDEPEARTIRFGLRVMKLVDTLINNLKSKSHNPQSEIPNADAETKSRIDSARDILVGKVPDPKSQVEQISIALIYKFMDDMDRQSEELGGKATFFSSEFKKYRWANLLDKRFGGHERLLLYAEGIEKMDENKNIPRLFRDIFKGVFLPYRNPETLNLFLKEIDGFAYDHSERLGDAYEYLLSVLGTQGDAGQFRTPRHIIDFIVAVVDPQKHETVLDPACGTAGFLISAFKHIVKTNENLTPDERARLMTNFGGYDIAPDMVRLSRVNMYLHGFPNPAIHEYDALTSEERWDERCDVIMANPPFMTPKGGIRPHNRFAVAAKRSEVLFVDYIAEHLNPGGRAGVIVPEGIIFQSQSAYRALRKMLIENYLWAVVSLPAGVFNPYSGVKTSILFLDRNLARRTEDILFVKVQNDGFDLGAQRRPIEKNNLPQALKIIDSHKRAQKVQNEGIALTVSRKRLLESGDMNLSGDRYRETAAIHSKWPIVKLGEVCRQERRIASSKAELQLPYLGLEDIESGTGRILPNASTHNATSTSFTFGANHVLYSKLRPYLNKVALPDLDGRCTTELIPILPLDRMIRTYLFWLLLRQETVAVAMDGKTGTRMPRADMDLIMNMEISLPPLDVQQRIVEELDGYRKVIEGARQVIANYKPTIKIDPEWPHQPILSIASLEYGLTAIGRESGDARLIRITDITNEGTLSNADPKFIYLDDKSKPYLLENEDVLVARTGATYGKTLLFDYSFSAVFASYLIRLRFSGSTLPRFYWLYAQSEDYWSQAKSLVTGGGQPQFNGNALKKVIVPVPPLAEQQRIVEELEAERALVESNRKLIEVFEKKIQEKLAEIWGEEEDSRKDAQEEQEDIRLKSERGGGCAG